MRGVTSWAAWCASRALVLELAAALGACGARAAQDGDAYVVLAEQEQVARYDRFELTVRPAPGHTMDAKSKVMVVFRSPSGHVQRVGAFVRAPGHAVRFAPREEGTYHYEVMVLGAGKERVVSRGTLLATPAQSRGFVRVSPDNPYSLVRDDGSQVLLLGENRFNVYDPTWNYEGRDIEAYLALMASYGENALRIFMFSDCDDESRPDRKQPGCLEPRVGHFDEDVASRYDRIFLAAEQHDMFVIPTLFAVGFTPNDVWKGWEDNPYSQVRGGPAATPQDFFTGQEARAAALERLHYVLARFGASRAFLAIDLINEPEWDGPVGEETWIAWATDLAHAFRAADPYGHLVTAGPVGLHWNLDGDERPWYGAPENDIVQWHLYGPEVYDVHALAREMTRKVQETWSHQKPVLVGEFAYGGENKDSYDHTHVGIWSATFSGAGVLAHSAPPFTEDSDEFMTPARGRHLRVLRDFLERLGTVGQPLTGERLTVQPADVSAWALHTSEGAALWLMAPATGYGAKLENVRVSVHGMACQSPRAELWDDVAGTKLGEAAVTAQEAQAGSSPCSWHLTIPGIERHLAVRLTTGETSDARGTR